MDVDRRGRAGEVAVVLAAAGLAQAVRALGCVGTVALYALALNGVALAFWLFAVSG